MTPWRRLVVPGVVGCVQAFVLAQSPETANPSPAFEVVSIRPNTSGASQMVIRTPPSGLVTGTNVTVTMLVRYGYGMPDYRIVGAPAWASTARFDVTARGPANASADTTRAMVRALLAERFGAVLRPDTREIAVGVLVRAGRDLGPNLRVASACDPAAATTGGERCGLRAAFGRLAGRDVPASEVAGELLGRASGADNAAYTYQRKAIIRICRS